ncbi:MAG: exopolysaccharide biosynthesis protein [Solirubrobacterales bacterium]
MAILSEATTKQVPEPPEKVSEQLARWHDGDGDKTLGGLIDYFDEKSFALLFVLLMGVPALPLPTGGATHVLEVVTVLLALQLVLGRSDIWLPQRWRKLALGGDKQQKFLTGLLKVVRRFERFSKPRMRFLFGTRVSNIAFGLIVALGAIAAFFAPPFSGLDTLPSLGVVLISIGVLLEDIVGVIVGLVIAVIGVAIEIFLGKAVVDLVSGLF